MRVDVYLFPAVVGGGLGDIEEVLAAGRRLARAGHPVLLYRRRGVPLPRSVDGPWDWPAGLVRTDRPVPRNRGALTVAPAWGVSAAADRPGRLGRGGAWAGEAAEIERVYGETRTLHVSLEEFARTLTSGAESRERLREGGVRSRELGKGMRGVRSRGEVTEFRAAFARFRAFDRPNLLHLFTTFRYDPGFAREFPNAVEVGPLWPQRFRPVPPRRPGRRATARRWVWYASPSSAAAILPSVLEGLAEDTRPLASLYVRSPRPLPATSPSPVPLLVETDPVDPRRWNARFRAADVRIVTGSRSLLEAIEVGGPFLYFNGILGSGARRRRHRPEKLLALLDLARRAGVPPDVRRDLADFSIGRRVARVVHRVAVRDGGWRRFARLPRGTGFAPPFEDAGRLIARVAAALARPGSDATRIVARVRARSNP